MSASPGLSFCTGCTNRSAKQVHGVFVREKEEVEGEPEQDEEPGGKDEREERDEGESVYPLVVHVELLYLHFRRISVTDRSCFLGLRRYAEVF